MSDIVHETDRFLGQARAAVTHRDRHDPGVRDSKGVMNALEAFAAEPDTEPETRPGTLTIECRALVMTYAHLRIRDPSAEARLSASMADTGQTSPVIVGHDAEGRPVLVDGYRRVRALARLGQDTVTAIALGVSEADALVYCHRQETSRRRSIVEEGWLVRELSGQGPTLHAVSLALCRSPSWVCKIGE